MKSKKKTFPVNSLNGKQIGGYSLILEDSNGNDLDYQRVSPYTPWDVIPKKFTLGSISNAYIQKNIIPASNTKHYSPLDYVYNKELASERLICQLSSNKYNINELWMYDVTNFQNCRTDLYAHPPFHFSGGGTMFYFSYQLNNDIINANDLEIFGNHQLFCLYNNQNKHKINIFDQYSNVHYMSYTEANRICNLVDIINKITYNAKESIICIGDLTTHHRYLTDDKYAFNFMIECLETCGNWNEDSIKKLIKCYQYVQQQQ